MSSNKESFDVEKPEIKPAYVRMIDDLGAILNPQQRWDALREQLDTFLTCERALAKRMNAARIDYEDGLKKEIAEQRESIVAIDAKLRFYEQFIEESDNSTEFKTGFKSALSEIRRAVERCPENDNAE